MRILEIKNPKKIGKGKKDFHAERVLIEKVLVDSLNFNEQAHFSLGDSRQSCNPRPGSSCKSFPRLLLPKKYCSYKN